MSDDHRGGECQQVTRVLARVGDKWSILIVRLLGDGSRRFNEMRRTLDGISQRMLTLTVRGLERDGLVKRTVYPTVPPRVDYELTELGRSLWQPVLGLVTWAQVHQVEIETANKAFDQRYKSTCQEKHSSTV
ncbi:MAG TPA: helix-turn-helix domain-containing protein [Oxalicibacterium sp.]|uniref:winged helix-turn-helix transcriptional regulator n=1 Tax=Oxalicibacterium sp. TaxID=2766525 RepID=UPI002CB11A45|nr:helix-turn-helix domain-containing protein [Oxalicibacterium sp.]HWU97226.1 helix-turn-helix domain-containing protein [Oxalicibacterium sp.]